MRRAILVLLTLVLASLSSPPLGYAQERVALVFGDGAYKNVPALPNPTNDAADMAATLQRLGFAVRLVTDGDYETMRRALLNFSGQIHGSKYAVIYFAGHGIEIGGENWLIPVDAQLKSDFDVEQEAIGLKSLVLLVSGASQLGLVMLDACRNNPFASTMERSFRTRSVDRGLARIEPTGSVLVAYAAKDGTTATDGQGRNSPFTAALLRHMETPGLEVSFLFRHVRDDVLASTQGQQEPFVYGSLSKESVFLKAPLADQSIKSSAELPAAAVPIAPLGPAPDEATWNLLKDTKDPDQLRRFIQLFPSSLRRREAEIAISQLISKPKAQPPTPPASERCISFNGQQVCE